MGVESRGEGLAGYSGTQAAALPGVGVESGGEGLAGCSGTQTAALPGVGVESRGEGLAGCSGTQVEEQLFLEWEWSPEGRDWLAVQCSGTLFPRTAPAFIGTSNFNLYQKSDIAKREISTVYLLPSPCPLPLFLLKGRQLQT